MTTATRRPTTEWMDRAACVGCPPEWWELTGESVLTEDNQIAVSICGGCPVRDECWQARGGERGVIIAGRRGGSKPRPKALPRPVAPPASAPPATRRPDCTSPDYASHKRHIMGGQEPCAACKAYVAERGRAYRAGRREAS